MLDRWMGSRPEVRNHGAKKERKKENKQNRNKHGFPSGIGKKQNSAK